MRPAPSSVWRSKGRAKWVTGRGRIVAPAGNVNPPGQFAAVSIETLLSMQWRMVSSPASLATVVCHVGSVCAAIRNLTGAHYPINDHGING